jgi:hypothetical protein
VTINYPTVRHTLAATYAHCKAKGDEKGAAAVRVLLQRLRKEAQDGDRPA